MSTHRRAADDFLILAGTDRLARRDARLSDPRPRPPGHLLHSITASTKRVCHTWL